MRCGTQAAALVRPETYVHGLLLGVHWAVLPSLAIANLTRLFSCSAGSNYLVYTFFLVWYFPLMSLGQTLVLNATSVLLIFGAPLDYAAYLRKMAWPQHGSPRSRSRD